MREEIKNWLKFLGWGIRLDSVIFFLGYPLLGALFTLPDFSLASILKLVIFGILNFLFLIQVFMFNDWGDFRLNPTEPEQRSHQALKYPHLVGEKEILIFCLILLIISLSGVFFLSLRSGMMMLLLVVISIFYSHPRLGFKKFLFLPELAHLLGGAGYFLAGWGVFDKWNLTAWFLAGFWGMILMAGNFANQIDHFEQELKIGLRTSAIYFGKRPVHNFALWIFLLSSFYFLIPAFQLGNEIIILAGIYLVLAWLVVIFLARKDRFLKKIKLLRRIIRVIYLFFSLLLIFALVWEKIR